MRHRWRSRGCGCLHGNRNGSRSSWHRIWYRLRGSVLIINGRHNLFRSCHRSSVSRRCSRENHIMCYAWNMNISSTIRLQCICRRDRRERIPCRCCFSYARTWRNGNILCRCDTSNGWFPLTCKELKSTLVYVNVMICVCERKNDILLAGYKKVHSDFTELRNMVGPLIQLSK